MEQVQDKFGRQFARQLAERHSQAVAAVIADGGNPYQRALDNSDEVDQLVEGLAEPDQEAFRALYVQEVDACTRAASDRAEATLLEAAGEEARQNMAGVWIGIVFGAVFLIYLLSR